MSGPNSARSPLGEPTPLPPAIEARLVAYHDAICERQSEAYHSGELEDEREADVVAARSALEAEIRQYVEDAARYERALRNVVHNANDLAHASAIHGVQDQTAIMLGDIARIALILAARRSTSTA